MEKIIVDFGNIIKEMKEKQIKLCLLDKRDCWFIIDNKNKLYEIETYYYGGFLDKFIIENIKIEFTLIPESISNNIKEHEKYIWNVEEVKQFIDNQHLNKVSIE